MASFDFYRDALIEWLGEAALERLFTVFRIADERNNGGSTMRDFDTLH